MPNHPCIKCGAKIMYTDGQLCNNCQIKTPEMIERDGHIWEKKGSSPSTVSSTHYNFKCQRCNETSIWLKGVREMYFYSQTTSGPPFDCPGYPAGSDSTKESDRIFYL